jgi:excisionase family DNA binding protein
VTALDRPASANGGVGVQGSATSNRLLSADDLAERWQVPRSQVYRLAREGRVPAVWIGRYVRCRPAEVEAFEQAGGVSP